MSQLIFSPSEFLRREFETRRARNPSFSLRGFAEKLDLPSGRLSEYMNNKRLLTPALAQKISDRLKFPARKRESFLLIVKAARQNLIQRVPLDLNQLLGDWRLAKTNSEDRFDFVIDPHPSKNGEITVSYADRGKVLRKNFSSVSETFVGGASYGSPMSAINEPQKFSDRLLVSSIYKCHPPNPLLCSALSEMALLSDSHLYYRRDFFTNYIDEGCYVSGADSLEAYYIRAV